MGYEISFTKYFYEYQPLRSLDEIKADILALATKLFGPSPLGTEGLTIDRITRLLNQPTLKMPGWKFICCPSPNYNSSILSLRRPW